MAPRHGQQGRGVWRFHGTIVGLFFGIPLGPFVGAVAGDPASGSRVDRAARVGVGTSIGLLIGATIKLAAAFMMVGTFLPALVL